MRTLLPQIVELYEIIADTIHTLTTSREPVLWRGAEWTPAAVERGELRGSVDGKAATVTLTACMDTLLTRYLASLPILPTRVNIYEHEPESGDTVQVFGGVVLEVIPGADATQVSVNCLSSSCILDAMLPRMIYSGQCQFVLFDSGCGLAAQSWGVTASVSVDGYLLASPSFAAYPNGYFTRGYAGGGRGFPVHRRAWRRHDHAPAALRFPGGQWRDRHGIPRMRRLARHLPGPFRQFRPFRRLRLHPEPEPRRLGIQIGSRRGPCKGRRLFSVSKGRIVMHYFDNEAAWEAFRAEAESWLGTPYRHLQRCRGRGADCTLFVGQALLDAGLLTRLEYDYYPRDWHEHTRDEYVLEASHRHMRDYLRPGLEMASLPVGTPLLRGDWLAFSTTERRVTNHCGLAWPCADGGFQMLHAINDRGVSFTPLGNWWLRRMTRHFRIVIAEAEVAAWA